MDDVDFLNYTGLTEDEITLLDDDVKDKLKIAYFGLRGELDSLKNSSELLRSELDNFQTHKDVEFSSLTQELRSVKDINLDLTSNARELEEECSKLSRENTQLTAKILSTKKEYLDMESTHKRLETDIELMRKELCNKQVILEAANNQITELLRESTQVRKLKTQNILKEEELKGLESLLKSKEESMKEEIEMFRRQNAWLEEQYDTSSNKVLTIRAELQEKLITLESEVGQKIKELSNLKSLLETKEQSIENLTQSNQEYLQKLQSSDEKILDQQRDYESEIASQKRLIRIYKEKSEENDAKMAEVQEGVQSLQKIVKQGQDLIGELQRDKSILSEQLQACKESFDRTLEEKQSELNAARNLVERFRGSEMSEEELRQINPAIAATVSALKRGKSLTQIYSEYVQLVEERDELRLDNIRLNEYVAQITGELEQRAPAFKSQQEQYVGNLQKLKLATQQIQELNENTHKMRNESDLLGRRAAYYQRQSERFKNTCKDLGRQVSVLLREVEAARGTVIRTDPDQEESLSIFLSEDLHENPDSGPAIRRASSFKRTCDNISSALGVIDQHLVTYRNMKELQMQNTRLLTIARDLSQQLESHENEEGTVKQTIYDLEQRCCSLSDQYDLTRINVNRLNDELRIVTKQRDSYKSILERYEISARPDENATILE
ncbi:hypothetical protein Ciccas_009585, partial [Cichlidogyrus casuarinus]